MSVKQALPKNSDYVSKSLMKCRPCLNASSDTARTATRSEITEWPYGLYQWLRVGTVFTVTTQLENNRSAIQKPWPVDIGGFRQREEPVANWLISDSYLYSAVQRCKPYIERWHDGWSLDIQSQVLLDESQFGDFRLYLGLSKRGAACDSAAAAEAVTVLLDFSTTHRMSCWLTRRCGTEPCYSRITYNSPPCALKVLRQALFASTCFHPVTTIITPLDLDNARKARSLCQRWLPWHTFPNILVDVTPFFRRPSNSSSCRGV